MDLEIREFSQAIISFVNASTLPMEVKRLCMAEIMEQIKEESNSCINAQLEERNKEKSKNLKEPDKKKGGKNR